MKHGTLYCYQKKRCRCALCRAANASALRSYRARRPEVTRGVNLKHSHGLTLQQWQTMFDAQGGVCAVCYQPETKSNQFGPVPLAVDHCHETGKIRGLLCMACNRAAGFLQHNPHRIRALADFLEKHQ